MKTVIINTVVLLAVVAGIFAFTSFAPAWVVDGVFLILLLLNLIVGAAGFIEEMRHGKED